MKHRTHLFLLICVVILFPSITTAQSFFAQQNVAVWEIFDRNNDVKLATSTKTTIRTNIEKAFTGSNSYKCYQYSIPDIKAALDRRQWAKSPFNIAKVIREISRAKGADYIVDYVIFTSVKIKQHSNSYDHYVVNISADLVSTETLKTERSGDVDMLSNTNAIPDACAKLLSQLLGEHINSQTRNNSTQQIASYTSQYQQFSDPQQSAQSFIEDANCNLGMKMIYVEGGSFMMGATSEQSDAAKSDERPAHTVRLEPYYIAECELTQAQWQKIMGNNPSYFKGESHPVDTVSWEDAQNFCRELSYITGKTYILPTEAQWEYAARGGKYRETTKYSGSYSVDAVAWYETNSNGSTHPVKQKRPNKLGIYDMSGNVWEWCSDWYSSNYYSSSPQSNPEGALSGETRVLRGGGYHISSQYCRVSYRDYDMPSYRRNRSGFRVVCLP